MRNWNPNVLGISERFILKAKGTNKQENFFKNKRVMNGYRIPIHCYVSDCLKFSSPF